ncbi:hypothetical protein MP638_002377 [Amoeboaphelidium occidentale]|nr:hypothetical protein MP638_002377 [Amoeboaphelidium occidentale]
MCFWPKSGLGKFCCVFFILAILAAIVIGIIVIVFATTFKVPTVEYQSAVATNKPPEYTTNPILLKMQWNISAFVTNENSYNIELVSGNLKAELAEKPGALVGTTDLNNVVFNGNGQRSLFTKNIDFVYDNSKDTDLAGLGLILASCRAGGNNLKIRYTIQANVKLNGLGPFPVPAITRDAEQQCPINLGTVIGNLGVLSGLLGSGRA